MKRNIQTAWKNSTGSLDNDVIFGYNVEEHRSVGMKVLLLENRSFDLDQLPDQVRDLRFAVLDNSNPENPDHFFIPLIFLESFSAPALVLRIGQSIVKMPLDWQILIGEPDLGDLEFLPLSSINDRGFTVFEYNPLTAFSPSYPDIEIIDVYQDVTWYTPKLKNGQILCIPIEDKEQPKCVYVVKDISRTCEIVDINKAW